MEVTMTTVTYTIPNISCGHCVHTVKNEVGELEGVLSVDADMVTKQATITFEPPADEDGIKELLAEINYPVAV
jgi:copper chaperone CopZ